MIKCTTIKQVRNALKIWGEFWATQEIGAGYASISVTARICEMLKTQVWASSDLHLFNHLSDNIHIPEHIKTIGDAVAKLSDRRRFAISQKYIKGKELDDYFIREGENELLSLI